MLRNDLSWIVALHGYRCICTACYRSSGKGLGGSTEHLQSVVATLNGIEAILTCTKKFSEHGTIQAEACAALTCLCAESLANKEKLLELDGIRRINCAYDSSVDAENGINTRMQACLALSTLAVHPKALKDIRTYELETTPNHGMVTKVNLFLKDESSSQSEDFPDKLLRVMPGLLKLVPRGDEDDDRSLRKFSVGATRDKTC